MDKQADELRQMFEPVDPIAPSDRRIAQRIRQPLTAEISQWLGDRCGMTFGVEVLDISTTGVGIVNSDRLEPGAKYLLQVARPNRAPLSAMFTVVRCDQSVGGLFNVTLEADEVLDIATRAARMKIATRPTVGRTPMLAVIFAALLGAAVVAYFMFR